MRYSILTVITFMIISGCSGLVKTTAVKKLSLKPGGPIQFLTGMHGAENIYIDIKNSSIYVTDLKGFIYKVKESGNGMMSIEKKLKAGQTATGIVEGADGFLYVCASPGDGEDWLLGNGGSIYRINKELTSIELLYGGFRGINGLAVDTSGSLYFTTGNLNIMNPAGAVYKIPFNSTEKQYENPIALFTNMKSPNGIFYSEYYSSLVITETFSGVSILDTTSNVSIPVFDKTRLVEGFDDLATDSAGRFWVAEPVGGFIKMFDPKTGTVVRYQLEGIGAGSSCRVGFNALNQETLYITEREINKNHDGRGLLAIPITMLVE